jgi:hypothetical protein
MHNFGTPPASLAPFLKKSGYSGYSGDKYRKHLNLYHFAVTTRGSKVSPLDLRVVTRQKSSGDSKVQSSQPFNSVVTAVTTVTTSFEEGGAIG